MEQQFLDFEGTKILANKIKEADNKIETLKTSQSLEYEGENITCENTLTSRTSDVVVSGQTYQNLVNSFNAGPGCTIDDFINIRGTGDVVWTLCDIKVKPQLSSNKIYTVIYNCINTSGNFEFAGFDSNGKWQLGSGVKKTGINKFLISNKDVSFVRIQTNENDASLKIDKNIIILEGDWTNKEVPLSITRIESAGEKENKISILSHNKNLATIATKGDTNFKVGYVKQNKTYTLNINRENKSIKYNIRKTNVNGNIIKENCSSDVNTFSCDEDCIVYINCYSKCNVNSVMLVEGNYNSDTMPKFELPKEDKKEILLPVEGGLKSLPNGVCDTIEQRVDGVYLVQRVGKTIINDSNYTLSGYTLESSGLGRACISVKNLKVDGVSSLLSNEVQFVKWNENPWLSQNECVSKLNNYAHIYIYLKNCNSIDDMKNSLNNRPITVYYELDTPVETKLDINNLDLEVYKETTYVTIDNAIQPTLSFKVPSNLGGVLEGNSKNVSELYKVSQDLSDKKFDKVGGEITGNVTLSNKESLLTFNTERSWTVKQGGNGANTSLDFASSTDGKSVRFYSNGATTSIDISLNSTENAILIDGNKVYHGGFKPSKADVGLGSVDNTSDLNKPISTATQNALDGKANSNHNHDDRYYTENEIDNKVSTLNSSIGEKVSPTGTIVANRVPIFSDTTGKVIKDSGFTIGASVPSGAKFTDTNTWRGIQDNLTSTSTSDSLSANQGKVLKGLIDGKANNSHTHDDRYYTENEIDSKLGGKVPTSSNSSITVHADSDSSSTTEFLSLKAGGNELKVTSSAGGSTPAKNNNNLTFNGNAVYHTGNKPSKSDVGLGNVDNTRDADKPISTATQNALNGKANASHNHDDLYYTESEINSKINTINNSIGTKLNASGGTITGNLVVNGSIRSNSMIPLGSLLWHFGKTAPATYLICDGAAVSRTTYADLFAIIGTTYGAGDGRTTFNLPNLMSAQRFVRSASSTSTVGTLQSESLADVRDAYEGSNDYNTLKPVGGNSFSSATSAEVRPVNIALLPCIKAVY